MWFWKKKKTNEVITNDCFQKLTSQQKQHFEQTNTVPTHKIEENSQDDNGYFALALIATDILMSDSDSGSPINANTSFEGFGGGSGGGGGAGSDWGSSDSGSSSIDSGSSFDSSSNF